MDRQNELRRICNYAVWRKESSKSASYFLLLFFHGYTRREVAALALLPIAAIHNKLKVGGYAFTEVHFAETSNEHLPTSSVPESVFEPTNSDFEVSHAPDGPVAGDKIGGLSGSTNTRLVHMEVDVLYRLNQLVADVGEPIQITRTPNGHIRVTGTVTSKALRAQISAALQTVPEHQLLQVQLATQGSLQVAIPSAALAPRPYQVYELVPTTPPANPILRNFFAAKGLTGNQIDAAVAQFSRDYLGFRTGFARSVVSLSCVATGESEEYKARLPFINNNLTDQCYALFADRFSTSRSGLLAFSTGKIGFRPKVCYIGFRPERLRVITFRLK